MHLDGRHRHHHRRHQANVGGDEDDDQERNDVPTSTLVAYSSSFSLGFLTCKHQNHIGLGIHASTFVYLGIMIRYVYLELHY